MIDKKNEFYPDYAVTPGEILSEELEIRGMSQQELARRTGITPKHIISILKAKSGITPETAIKFERALGMPAQFWLNLESNYQEIVARLAEKDQLDKDSDWLKRLPVNEMVKLGWIEKRKDKKEKLIEILRFFGIGSVKQWAEIWPNLKVAFRQNQKHEVFPEAVSAWLRQGEIEASQITCEPYDKTIFRDALDKVRDLTTKPPEHFIQIMQDLCAKAGVAIVFVPALPKTGVSGATRWLNKDKAIIQLSLRYKTDDHLWFTFFHEAGHILLHGKKELFLEGPNTIAEEKEKEKEADRFSETELIPQKEFAKFITQTDFSARAITDFAISVGISPGIVVGQLQHRELLKYCQHDKLKQRFEWN